MPYRVGVDIGTTFTSLVAHDETTGNLTTLKILTTSKNREAGFINCLHRFLDESKIRPHRIKSIVYTNSPGLDGLNRPLQFLETLLEEGIAAPVYLMLSDGTVTNPVNTYQTASPQPLSASSSSLIAAVFLAEQLAERNIISLEIGAKSTRIAVVRESEIPQGKSLKLVNVGGGSIIRLDELGQVCLGPEFAGAEPGPACYDRGGSLPTITDAYAAIGALREEYPLCGTLKLNVQNAIEALKPIAEQLGRSVETVALGAINQLQALIVESITALKSEMEINPDDLLLVATGGCGPLLASGVARRLDVKRILIPPSAGVASALSLLTTDLIHESTHPCSLNASQADADELDLEFRSMERKARALLESSIDEDNIVQLRSITLRYTGDSYSQEVNLESGTLRPEDMIRALESLGLGNASGGANLQLDSGLEIVGLKVKTIGVMTKPDLRAITTKNADSPHTLRRRANVTVAVNRVAECAIYDRNMLRPSMRIEGPAIINDYGSTSLLLENDKGVVDASMNLIVEVRERLYNGEVEEEL